jgi:hypothetical protein
MAGSSPAMALGAVPVLRSGMKNVAPRPGHGQNLMFDPLDNYSYQSKFLGIPPHMRGVTGTLVARGGMRRLRAWGSCPAHPGGLG